MFANDLMVHSASVFPVRDWPTFDSWDVQRYPLLIFSWLKDPHQAIENLRSFPVKIDGSKVQLGEHHHPKLSGVWTTLHVPSAAWWPFLSPKCDLQIGGRCGWFPDLWMGWNRGFTALMEGLWLTILPSCFDPVSLRVLPLRVSLARYDSNMGDRWPKNESCLESKMCKVFWECRV